MVTGNPDEPPRDSSLATKIETPLLETPRSVSIIDRRTLDDMGAINITQAHDYVVGVIPMDERGPAFARGFPVGSYDLRRDGLRIYSWSVREPVAVDRIQYLRGPAAVLYGDGSPGALVNMVLKKPLPVPRYEFGVSGGSSGFGRLTADLTGPLTREPACPLPRRRGVGMARERVRQRRASLDAAAHDRHRRRRSRHADRSTPNGTTSAAATIGTRCPRPPTHSAATSRGSPGT